MFEILRLGLVSLPFYLGKVYPIDFHFVIHFSTPNSHRAALVNPHKLSTVLKENRCLEAKKRSSSVRSRETVGASSTHLICHVLLKAALLFGILGALSSNVNTSCATVLCFFVCVVTVLWSTLKGII